MTKPFVRSLSIGAIAALVLLATSLRAQTFPTPITQAIALLTSGTTPFSTVGINANGYVNFGTLRGATGYGIRDNAGVIEAKNSAGAWASIISGGGAPTTATFITQTPNASLSAEQPLSALASALLLNTTTTGVLTAYTGSTCTNEVVTALNALGVATCDPVTLTTMVTGTLPVANGGSGAATLTGLLQGNGTSAVTAIASSTIGQVLRVTGANTSAFGAIDLDDTDAVTGTLGVANGGTNLSSGTSGGILGFTASGTVASSAALTANAIVLGGGAGATPSALGSLGTTTTVLHGNAAGAPTFGAVNLATDTTGSIGVAQGGTGNASYTIGDLLQATGATTLTPLPAVSAGSFLRSGGVGAASAWSTAKWPNTAATGDVLYASGANQYANLADVAAGSFLRSGGVGIAPTWSTSTWPNALVQGDLIVATAANTAGVIAAVGTGRILSSNGVGAAPVWLTNPTASTFEVSTAFIGPGTEASTGVFRLANTSAINARNAGDTADLVLLTSTAADRVLLGGANTTGFTFATGSNNLYVQGTTPTISSGFGTTPAIAGTASTFRVTVGAGGDTTGVVLFSATWANAPVCQANNETTAQLVRATPTTTQVTIAGTMTAADVVSVTCVGY